VERYSVAEMSAVFEQLGGVVSGLKPGPNPPGLARTSVLMA
jgi:hypothetical protein